MSAVAPGPASASPRTLLTLADGGVIDLLAPMPADYTPLAWAAEHLAKEARYNGATPCVVYSVAQHLTECAYAAFEQTGDREVAAYCALHDVHEAVWRDDTTPKKLALAAVAVTRFGVLAATVMEAFAELTDRHDAAIHAAAGLAWPPPTAIAANRYSRSGAGNRCALTWNASRSTAAVSIGLRGLAAVPLRSAASCAAGMPIAIDQSPITAPMNSAATCGTIALP